MDEDDVIINGDHDEDDSSSDSSSDQSMQEDFNEEKEAETLSAMQKQVEENPYNYDLHLILIQQAKRCGEWNALSTARKRMSEIFPLTPELWKEWLDDEVSACDKSDEKQFSRICELYEKSVLDYLSVNLWLDYAMFVMRDFSSDDAMKPVRTLFERAIEQVGLHVSEAKMLWDAYREVEKGHLDTMIAREQEELDSNGADMIMTQAERIQLLFKRQLSVPLIDMEETFAEYEQFVAGDVDEIVKAEYSRAQRKLKEIISFEEKLISASESEKYRAYTDYIDFELKSKEPLRARILYERALVVYCLSGDLWFRYLEFLDRQLKNESWSISTHERSVRNLPWEFELWASYLKAVEMFGLSKEVFNQIWSRALSNGCTLYSQLVELWLCRLTYERRSLDLNVVDGMAILRQLFGEAVKDLNEKGADPSDRIRLYWIAVEADVFKDLEKARMLWDEVMKNHQRESRFWLDYFNFERINGDADRCRKLLKKAMLRNLDDTSSVADAWIMLENTLGTLDQWYEARSQCHTALKKLSERLAKASIPAAAEAQVNKRVGSKGKPALEKTEGEPKKPKRRRSDDGAQQQNGVKTAVDQEGFKVPVLPPTKKQKTTSPSSITYATEEPVGTKEERTVFVSNLNYDTTAEAVFGLLSKAGPVRDVRFATDPRGKSRGFCYVEFINPVAVPEAVKLDRTPLDGRPAFISRDSSTGERENHYKGNPSGEEKNKIFVRGLLTKVTADQLRSIFEPFGTLKDVRVVTHKNGISKGIAYVEYLDAETARKALLALDGKDVEGKPMALAISNPPVRDPSAKKAPNPLDRAPKSALPVVPPAPEGQRKSRSHLALVPRTVKQKSDEVLLSNIAGGANSFGSKENSKDESKVAAKSNQDFRNLFNKKL